MLKVDPNDACYNYSWTCCGNPHLEIGFWYFEQKITREALNSQEPLFLVWWPQCPTSIIMFKGSKVDQHLYTLYSLSIARFFFLFRFSDHAEIKSYFTKCSSFAIPIVASPLANE